METRVGATKALPAIPAPTPDIITPALQPMWNERVFFKVLL
jgi:hypothetical protein